MTDIIYESLLSCVTPNVSLCMMEVLRGSDAKCSNAEKCDGGENVNIKNCGSQITKNVFCGTAKRTDNYAMCCKGDKFSCTAIKFSFSLIIAIVSLLATFII